MLIPPLLLTSLLLGCTADGVDSGAARLDPDLLFDGFHVGVNEPWLGYGTDFGHSAWGDFGLTGQLGALDQDLAAVGASGARVVRWFILTDGRSGVQFDAGVPVGLDDDVFDDLDLLLDRAGAHGLLVVPVLLDFLWLASAEQVEGVQLGGHADVMRDPAAREALVDLVIRPLLSRYGDRPEVLAWDLMNEPVWAIGSPDDGWLGDGVTQDELRSYFDLAASAVHEETGQLATIGCASAVSVPLWSGVELDLIQLHAYDGTAFEIDAVDVCGELPCVVGELGTGADDGDLLSNIERLQARGYHGVWPWSLRAVDAASDLDLDELAAWLGAD